MTLTKIYYIIEFRLLKTARGFFMKEKFLHRMQTILGDEYGNFVASLEKDNVRGLRANRFKCDKAHFLSLIDMPTSPIGYVDNGFILNSTEPIGTSPLHHAGMIYMQDPGAMSAVAAVNIEPDFKILDMCAAPGGKSSQAAEFLGDEGFILSNEYVPKRAKIIVSNFERLGIKNAIVTSLSSGDIAKMYEDVFDLVIVDAPCSGEGMFRKSDEAIECWSEENVLACSKRQLEIIENAKSTVRRGGYLLYSTCTYSLEENEMVVDEFLERNPEFELIPVNDSVKAVTRDGISFDGCKSQNLSLTRRFYPHISEGEGQFIALMRRNGGERIGRINYKDAAHSLSRTQSEIVKAFFKENMLIPPIGRLGAVGDNIVLITHDMPIPQHSVFMSGVMVGEIRGNMLVPSHQFFSCYGHFFKSREIILKGDERIERYLKGEEIEARLATRGWCAILYEGVTVGGGKCSDGKIKNHYPKGLRNK